MSVALVTGIVVIVEVGIVSMSIEKVLSWKGLPLSPAWPRIIWRTFTCKQVASRLVIVYAPKSKV